MENITDAQYIAAAIRLHDDPEGEIGVDPASVPLPKTRVSRGDPSGAFVSAWVWVPQEEAEKEQRA